MNKLKIQQDIHNLYHYETHKDVKTEYDIIRDLNGRVDIQLYTPNVNQDDIITLEDGKIIVDTSELTSKDMVDYTDNSDFSHSLTDLFEYICWLENKLLKI